MNFYLIAKTICALLDSPFCFCIFSVTFFFLLFLRVCKMTCFACSCALWPWHVYVLGVLHKNGVLGVLHKMACVKLLKCFLYVFDHGALVNCGLYWIKLIILNQREYELMYLMEGRKLLDTRVFNGRQEIAKPIITNIVVPWVFEIFVSFPYFTHTWSEKAYIV